MINLSLIRHAKANWVDYDGNDLNRSISDIGKDNTLRISNFLKKKNFFCEEIFCSPAKRTKQTKDILIESLQINPTIRFIEELYHSSRKNIFDTLMLEAEKKNILIISHEPLLSESIENFFFGMHNNDYIRKAISNFSTSSFLNMSFNCDMWSEINIQNCKVNYFVTPDEL
ncbi:MAG: SixA phosphatase family protein [Alphaproteobacteria bacterium]|tara:strand:+ start:262 stop:774 length:513 start_codon:yes stop_codon:yes gene_type:complete